MTLMLSSSSFYARRAAALLLLPSLPISLRCRAYPINTHTPLFPHSCGQQQTGWLAGSALLAHCRQVTDMEGKRQTWHGRTFVGHASLFPSRHLYCVPLL